MNAAKSEVPAPISATAMIRRPVARTVPAATAVASKTDAVPLDSLKMLRSCVGVIGVKRDRARRAAPCGTPPFADSVEPNWSTRANPSRTSSFNVRSPRSARSVFQAGRATRSGTGHGRPCCLASSAARSSRCPRYRRMRSLAENRPVGSMSAGSRASKSSGS